MDFSRRVFMAGSGALAMAGAFPGLAQGVRSGRTRLLPAFARPDRLHVGEVSDLSGADQTLLTTLQGVVNRRKPELYYLFSSSDSDVDLDARWLSGMRLPVTRYDDPLDLVGRFAGRVRGAIVPDPEVPDTINIATTLAGLEDCVVATAEQAAAHRLRIVRDLRGQFADDRVAIHRWQFQNLFPRCSHRLLAGLPPTMVVDVEGIEWREVARETRQIRDESNRGMYTFDLTPDLGSTGEVYVKFGDSFGDDGWGASVLSVKVTANGTEIAAFAPDTPAEQPFLFDGSRSSIGGAGNRFADGGNYFIYRFEPPAGTTSLSITVEMWNQYLVSATDTAPTRVEAFPYFRDYVVATRSMVSWLPPNGPTGDLLREILAAVEPATPYAGWFSGDVAGEWSGVDLASQAGVEVLPADFYMNGTVHSGVTAPISSQVRPVPQVPQRNKIYLTLTFGEGDNVQYCQRHLREIWDDPRRGEAPANWTISPLLADIGPALYSYYQRTATRNDLLICGPSGAGYTYPGAWPDSELAAYLQLTGDYMRLTGLDLVYAYPHRDGDAWVPFSEQTGRGYARYTPVRGVVQSWGTGDLLVKRGGIPVIGNFSPPGKAAEYKAALDQHVASWDGSAPLFVAGGVNAWSWTPSDVADLAELLDDKYELVRGDTFFTLLAKQPLPTSIPAGKTARQPSSWSTAAG